MSTSWLLFMISWKESLFCFALIWPPTCVDFGRAKFVRKLMQVFHRLAAQRKSTQVDRKSAVYAWNLLLFALCMNLRAVCTQVLVFQTCVDLQVRLTSGLTAIATRHWHAQRLIRQLWQENVLVARLTNQVQHLDFGTWHTAGRPRHGVGEGRWNP